MSVPTSAPEDRRPAPPLPRRAPVDRDDLAEAIMRELRNRTPAPVVSRLTGRDDPAPAPAAPATIQVISAESGAPVLVSGTAPSSGQSVVVAAVDDDANPGRIIRYAAAQARRRGVPLRVVHVWTGRAVAALGLRMIRHDRITDADRLLSAVLYDHLPPEEAEATEREILHDRDVVSALIALSADASLLVLAARSGQAAPGEPLGDTVRALVGYTACPLAVVPPATEKPPAPGAW